MASTEDDHRRHRSGVRRRSAFPEIAVGVHELPAMVEMADAEVRAFGEIARNADVFRAMTEEANRQMAAFEAVARKADVVAAVTEEANARMRAFEAAVGQIDKGFAQVTVGANKFAAMVGMAEARMTAFQSMAGQVDKGFDRIVVGADVMMAVTEEANARMRAFEDMVGQFDKGFGWIEVGAGEISAVAKQADANLKTLETLFSGDAATLRFAASTAVKRRKSHRPEPLVLDVSETHSSEVSQSDRDAQAKQLAQVVSELSVTVKALQRQLAESAVRTPVGRANMMRNASMLIVLVISLEVSAMLLISYPALHEQINDLFELPMNVIGYAMLLCTFLAASRR